MLLYWWKEGTWTWRPLYEPAPDPRFLIDLRVGGESQLVGNENGMPMGMFHPDGINVELRLAQAGPNKHVQLPDKLGLMGNPRALRVARGWWLPCVGATLITRRKLSV